MKKRVLVVNDSEAVLHTLDVVLRKAGYDVDLANRPEAALAKAPEADVMLCDSVVAGDKHGSVARQAQSRNKRLKVLLWIGAGEQPRDFMKRHFARFWTIPKPIDPPLLMANLRRALQLA